MTRWILLPLLALLPILGLTHERDAANDHVIWSKDIAAFEAADRAQPPAPGAVLFIGSSSIRFWTTLASDFPEVRTINRGFGGSEINDSTWFADRIVAPYKPSAIVMYAGDNDIAAGDSPGFVLQEFQDFVRKARSVDPGVPIAFIAIKPSMARKALLPQIREANDKIRDWAATQSGVTYLDIFTPMLGPDGQPQDKWFREDGLHMNRSGYALWIGIVKPWVDAHGKAAMRH
jgi:lysophospholipase L1-like esterase